MRRPGLFSTPGTRQPKSRRPYAPLPGFGRTEKGKSVVFLLSLREERCFCWLSLLGRVLCLAVVPAGCVLFFAVVAVAHSYLAVVPGVRSFCCCRCGGAFLGSRPRDALYFAVVAWLPGSTQRQPKATTANKARVPPKRLETGRKDRQATKQYPEKRRIATSRTSTSCTNNESATQS